MSSFYQNLIFNKPKHILQNELDAVLRAVGQFTEGTSVKNISAVVEKSLPLVPYRICKMENKVERRMIIKKFNPSVELIYK